MNAAGITRLARADRWLLRSTRAWFAVAIAGQLLFAVYILAFYGGAVAAGAPQRWNEVLPHGYHAGETVRNVIVGAHLLVAAIVTLGGPLQLIAAVRVRWPRLHRWNGRVYLATAVIASISGVLMKVGGPSSGDPAQRAAILFNAVVIVVFAALALRHAIARDIARHRRWAMRLFLVVSGVWFFRVGLMFWILANGGPVGFDTKTFTGPALVAIAWLQTLFPLVVHEAWLRVRAGDSVPARVALALVLVALTAATLAGIGMAAHVLWWPHMR